MAELSRFFPSVDSDRLYTASQVNEYLYETLEEENGVLHLPAGSSYAGELAVTNDGTLSVDIATGAAVKLGALYLNTASLHKSLTAVASGSQRYDRIVIRTSVANRNMVATIIAGVEGIGTPAVPSVVAGTDVLLAKILIDRSSGSYVYTVTDEREFRDYIFISEESLVSVIEAGTATATPLDTDILPAVKADHTLLYYTIANFWTWIKSKISALTAKTTPVGADSVVITDSAASDVPKRTTLTNLASAWGVLVAALTGKTTPVDADTVLISDSAAAGVSKSLTWANIKSVLATAFKHGGSNEIATATPTANAIVKADANAHVDGWVSDASTTVKGKVQTTITPATVTTGTDTALALTAAALKTSTPQLSGIAFPATQVPSADANTLDDYEEGSFTPAATFGGGNTGITYDATNGGTYVKVGRKVRVKARLAFSNKGSSTGVLLMTGLPFARSATASESASNIVFPGNVTYNGIIFSTILASATSVSMFTVAATGGTTADLTDAAIANNSVIRIDIEYFV